VGFGGGGMWGLGAQLPKNLPLVVPEGRVVGKPGCPTFLQEVCG
jgi:hypothetical protein